jgi:hypothetical protein
MVSKREFSNVPIEIIPADLQEALYSLLDEELIIRRDAPLPGSASAVQETVNFTFDEFRDFMLSQYLVQNVFSRSQDEFIGFISETTPEREQAIEGLKRFLFYASRKQPNIAFGTFYRSQPWYSDVYFDEVFSLDVRSLEIEDGKRIRTKLEANDNEAKQVARTLAYRWNSDDWPILNLGLLLDYVEQAGPSAYDNLIATSIGVRQFHGAQSMATAFCSFVNQRVEVLKTQFPIYEDVVRFLILLLPIESTYVLSSPAYDVLVRVIHQQSEETTTLLLNFLALPFLEHQPFIWRLLYEAMLNHPDERILAAVKDALTSPPSPRSLVEIKRIEKDFASVQDQQ